MTYRLIWIVIIIIGEINKKTDVDNLSFIVLDETIEYLVTKMSMYLLINNSHSFIFFGGGWRVYFDTRLDEWIYIGGETKVCETKKKVKQKCLMKKSVKNIIKGFRVAGGNNRKMSICKESNRRWSDDYFYQWTLG